MSKRTRRMHSPAFKAKVALAAVKGEKTLVELTAALRDTQNRSAKILKRIEEDDDAPRTLTTRLKELEAEAERLEYALAHLPEQTILRLPANYEQFYRKAVTDLTAHLESEHASGSRKTIRAMIEKVVVGVGNSRGGKKRALQLHGDLYRLLDFAHRSAGRKPAKHSDKELKDSGTQLVAGAGFEPAAFRL